MHTSSPEEIAARRLRDLAIVLVLQVAATAVLLFLILRVAAPWLVSAHQTLALWAAGLLLLACPLIVLQAGYVIWRSWRRLRGARAATVVRLN